MVKPGGTGNPMRHISARFAPLPPSSGFIVPLPSVFFPNWNTYLPDAFAFGVVFGRALFFAAAFFAVFFAIRTRSPLLLRHDLGNVCNVQDQSAQRGDEAEPRRTQALVLGHHQHVIEKLRHRRLERRDSSKGVAIVTTRRGRANACRTSL